MKDDARAAAQIAYQNYVQHMLQAMVNFVGDNPDVNRMWLYTNMAHQTIQSYPFFRFEDGFYGYAELQDVDPDNDHDVDALLDEMEDSNADVELVRACRAAGAVPERIITTYDPHTGELESQWDYEGIKISEDDNYGRALDRWIRSMGGKPIFARE